MHWAAVRGCSEAATILLQVRYYLKRTRCSSATAAFPLIPRLGTSCGLMYTYLSVCFNASALHTWSDEQALSCRRQATKF